MQSQSTASADLPGWASDLVIMLGGIITSALTVELNTLLIKHADMNFLGLSMWFIIPVGALCGGMAAASGYYFTAVWTNHMPTKRFLLEMAVVGASTWLYVHWSEYSALTFPDGSPISSRVGFWEYFTYTAEHQTLTIKSRGSGSRETGELGVLGYARELLQLLGFLGGGVAVWFFLDSRERCDPCRRYAKVRPLLKKVSPDHFFGTLEKAQVELPDVNEDAAAKLGKRPLLGLDLSLSRCPKCQAQWARPFVITQNGNSEGREKLKRYDLQAEQATALASACDVK